MSATHVHRHHRHGPDELVASAVESCREAGRQFTPLRRRVFEALAEASGPLGAYDIVEQLGREKRISPISVYRALDFLIEAGLIHRVATRNTYLPCHHLHAADETTVFLVCTRCGGVDELASPELGRDLRGMAAASGFRPGGNAVEIEGECAECREGEAASAA